MDIIKKLFIKTCIVAFTCISVSATSAQFSQAQISQFQNLPSGQQQALAKQFGVDINDLKSGSNNNAENTQTTITPVQPRPVEEDEVDLSIEEEFLLKGAKKELKPFGYDIFANAPSTFNPVANIAIPSDYIIGVGDTVSLRLFGKESADYSLLVSPEGSVFVPELGQFQVAGLSFSELKLFLVEKVKERVIGVDAIVSLSELKSIRVFVLGDAYKPGAYNLSSLSSISHALFSAGGVNDIGSLRNIQLKRSGKLIQNFDLYDLLIKGDARSDVLLQSGDVVFIEPKGSSVSVTGEVRRPAIYETIATDTANDVINMSGGLLPNAHKELITINRINNNFRTAINIDLTNELYKNEPLYSGDVINVRTKSQSYRNTITLIGAVTRPGKYQWEQGDKISDVFESIKASLLPDADLFYSLIVREIDNARNIEVYQFSVAKALENTNNNDNLLLKSNDKIVVFSQQSLLSDKEFDLERFAFSEHDLLKKEQQTAKDDYAERAFWNKYKSTNEQDNSENSNVNGFNQALASANNIQNASLDAIEANQINQASTINNRKKSSESENINDDEKLREYNVFSRKRLLVTINQKLAKQSASGQPLELVEIDGQVKFPGVYPLTKNGKVSDLVIAAGGVKESAYLSRIDITRNIIKESKSNISKVHQASKENLQLNLAKALADDGDHNVVLQSKDRLYIHQIPSWSENQTVELKGEFVFPGKYTIQRGDTLKDIIQRAGGFTSFAAIEGSIFTREKLKELEQENIDKLSNNLRIEFAAKSLTDNSTVSYADSQQLISDLSQVSPVGRLVIDLETIIHKKSNDKYSILLEEGDVLFVPALKNSINVIGQVQVTSSHLYQQDKTVSDYLAKSGGVKKRADKKRIYIITANGSVKIMGKSKSWFASNNSALQPGDTIVVPLDSDYINNLDLWSAATDIIFNTAVALAAIGGI